MKCMRCNHNTLFEVGSRVTSQGEFRAELCLTCLNDVVEAFQQTDVFWEISANEAHIDWLQTTENTPALVEWQGAYAARDRLKRKAFNTVKELCQPKEDLSNDEV